MAKARRRGVTGRVEAHPDHGFAQRVGDVRGLALPKDPERAARKVLSAFAEDLGIDPALSSLRFETVRRSVLGTHVTFQQRAGGRPVTGAWVRVDLDRRGRAYNVQSDLVPAPRMVRAKALAAARPARAKPLSARAALAAARRALGRRAGKRIEVLSRESVSYPKGGVPLPATKLVVRCAKPAGEWKVYVDAATGGRLGVVSLRREAKTGKGRVFDPNPVAALDDSTLRDTSAIPDAAYVEVDLPDLDGTGYLDGKYASTATTRRRARRTDHDFRARRGEGAFAEGMVYWHVDRAQRRLQALGIHGVLDRAIRADVAAQADDNSHYSLVTKDLHFGTGGVDDAEDAEIVVHEYGHAIQDAQMPGFGASDEAAAMGEGFGDYLAASVYAERKPARLRPCVGTWDGVAYSRANPPCLRRVDGAKRYPRDVSGEPHDDGEIWSASLWEIRAALGADDADRLVLAHHHLVTPRATFAMAAKALATADEQLYGGRHGAALRRVLERRGILRPAAAGARRRAARR